jgi:glutamate racemase
VAGVLATAGTLKSEKFQALMQAHALDCKLICVAGVGLVEAIEGGDIDSPALCALLESYLKPILDAGADTLALGCTHYPFLIPLIKRLAGSRLEIIDNSPPVARQLERTLALHGQLRRAPGDVTPTDAHRSWIPSGHTKNHDGPCLGEAAAQNALLTFCTTGTPAQLSRLAEIGLGLKIDVAQITIASPLTCQI